MNNSTSPGATATVSRPAEGTTAAPSNDYPWYTPRFWHGMTFGQWLQLAREGNFDIRWQSWGLALTCSLVSSVNSCLVAGQWLLWDRAIRETELVRDPIFILGHWRSGTTFLHELLSLDEQFTSPTTYQCFAPEHFVLTGWIMPYLLFWSLPAQRPTDNMAVGFERPQEDEFALCAMGLPTPMRHLAFPMDPPRYLDWLDLEGVDSEELNRWKEGMRRFLKAVTYQTGKPITLKSPPHTGRIGTLREMFPNAKFIHISRHPYAVVPSTLRLWRSLIESQTLQRYEEEHDLLEYVFQCYERMYGGFERGCGGLPDDQLCQVRFEDVTRDPVAAVAGIYEQLGLEGYDAMAPTLREFAENQKEYKPAEYRLPEALQGQIDERMRGYLERYGYA